MPANLALEPYLERLAVEVPGVEFRKTEAYAIIEEAQTRARAAGWVGDVWTGEGVGSGPFFSLSPGKLTGGGTGILALYWTVAGEDATDVVSSVLLPHLGTPFRGEGFELRSAEFVHDMSAWCIKKSADQLRDALYIKRELERAPGLPDAFKDEVMSHLGHLAWNGTKLLAFSCGGEWGTDDGLYDIDDMNRRTRDHSWAYAAPEEAADEILNEAIADFFDEMKRKAELGFADAALGVGVGIIGGLYDGREPAAGSVLDWAHDFPLDATARVVRDLRRTCPPEDRADVIARLAAAVEERAPEWSNALAREATRA